MGLGSRVKGSGFRVGGGGGGLRGGIWGVWLRELFWGCLGPRGFLLGAVRRFRVEVALLHISIACICFCSSASFSLHLLVPSTGPLVI